MKISSLLKKTIFGAILLLAVFLGIKIANFSYKYEVVTEGLLGSFFIYLFWRYVWPSIDGGPNIIDGDIDEYKYYPQGVKLIASVFIYSIFCFWAIVRVANLMELIFKSLK